MQTWVKFELRMNITDEETFSTAEHASVIRGGTLALGLGAPERRVVTIGKCGAQRLVEVQVWYRQVAGGGAQLRAQAALLEGAADDGSADVRAELRAVVGAGESRSFTVPLRAAGAHLDFARITLAVSVLALNPAEPEAALSAAAAALGAEHTGTALSGCEAVRGGFRQRFERCDLYLSPEGAHVLGGDVRRKYDARGGPDSDLGLPRSGQLPNPDGLGTTVEFSGDAALSWHPRTGPMVVSGAVRAHWQAAGAERGPLGYPTSDTLSLCPGPREDYGSWQERSLRQEYAAFQNGVIFAQEGQVSRLPSAALSGSELRALVEDALRKALVGPGALRLGSVALIGVSDTTYDFTRSGNRVLTYRATGTLVPGLEGGPRPDVELTIPLQFVPSPHPDGRRAVRLMVRQAGVIGLTSGSVDGSGRVAELLGGTLVSLLPAPRRLGHLPSSAGLLSFKVTAQGGLCLYFRPDRAGALAAHHAQTVLDVLVRRAAGVADGTAAS